ncbi:uncharacterized protein LOC114455726 isoform X2 [Gouania willdenowi]|uniref:Uncharacterized LOC114455726 n=1 Tax=Gouania willdenowi TaxID=441366 RepID=A0A8C5N3Y0_GOUWI|nr:uncharacterized protein LOC114455726 isoform X2 [Gouania willdenowi]
MNFGHVLSFIVTFTYVAGQSPKYALLGDKVSLNPKIDVSPEGIHVLWKHNGDKVVEFNGHEERVYGSYENRVTLDWHSADLGIGDLRYEDTGEYELEIHRSKILHRSKHKLEVIEQVSMPTISCEINDDSRSDTSEQQATLTCSAKTTKSHPVTHVEWNSHGIPEPGPNLTISLGLQHNEEVYSCTVKNPLTNQTATFTAKECYDDTSQVVCTIAVICAAVIAAIAAALAVVFCKLKQKACFATYDNEDVEKQPPLLNPNGFENEKADHEEWRNSLHNRATLPSNQRLRHLSQLDEQSDDCVSDKEEEIKLDRDTIKGTSNSKGDLGERERLLHNRSTLPFSQRLGHLAHLNEEHNFVSNDDEKEMRKGKEEDNDVKSYTENNVSPDAQSTQNSANATPIEEEFKQEEFALSEKDYVDIIDRKSGESDSGLDEERESVILPSLLVIDKEEITVEGPNDDDQQKSDDELSEDESYNKSLSTADRDDTGINQTLNTNYNIPTEPLNAAHTASDNEKVDILDSKSSIPEVEATEEGNEGPKESNCKEEDDVIPKPPDETGGESHSEEEEEEEIKAEKLKEEPTNPEHECDSTPAEEESATLTDEDTPQQRVENLGHDAANGADNHLELESTRKSSLSDTSQQPRSPTLSKQEDINSCSECFDVQADQESRHNSVSDQGPNKEEAFIDDEELQCGPEEQRLPKEGLCENKEGEKQNEEVE